MVDETLTLVGDVFITIVINEEKQVEVEDVYANQYLADQAAERFNRMAKEKGRRARMAVIYRDLYSF